MAEEVQNASTIVPWCMVATIALNGTLGFAICIAFSFTLGNLNDALTTATGYDFIEVFYNATGNLAGSSVMTAILIALVTCASFGFLATSSRQTWAFARDRGLPFSDFLSYVGSSALPLRSVFFCATITALIGLINIGSSAAFNAIVSITIGGLFISYLIAILLMIRKRVKREHIRMGPFSLGKWGLATNIIAACFLTISTVFSFFPPAVPVTLVTMNWSCVVFGGVVLMGLAYYAISGRHRYNGPIIERPILLTERGLDSPPDDKF